MSARWSPGRALDLACGEGRNAVWLAERGWQVTGVDFSEVALGKAERLAASRGVEVEWTLADLREHRPRAQAFDLVAVLYLQLPPDERRLVLGRAADAVAPGGSAYVLGHHTRNLTEGHGGPKDVAVLFTPEDAAADLGGLVVEPAETVERRVELEDGGGRSDRRARPGATAGCGLTRPGDVQAPCHTLRRLAASLSRLTNPTRECT